ncbi:cation:proton antiporter [Desulfamplus magnetovallimortis]|nr:cation:proton antiporter [Desulfamplus magnetovallimortis]
MAAMENINITFALAILLATGFAAARAGTLVGLPSVTGYILAGIALGPSGLDLIPHETVNSQLKHFTEIALMLIAFGIGEHLEIMRLRSRAKSVITIGISEILGAFICVMTGTFLVARLLDVGGADWNNYDYLLLATLFGAVSVATAPAATLHVMREIGASGPFTTTLMAVVAIDNGLAIMLFGIAVSITHHVITSEGASIWVALSAGLLEICGSLTMGIVTGMLMDSVANRLKNPGEILTAGLAALLLCGEIATLLNFSPLLAGIAAGFTIVNRDYRDIRLFRHLNAFEPPIYVLFFTLAGIHLNLKALAVAGWLGIAYFLFRIIGKIAGAALGSRAARTSKSIRNYLGLGLTPQAGVAIGLVFLINGDPVIQKFSVIIAPVVLAGVLLSELIGPLCTRKAIELAGENRESLLNTNDLKQLRQGKTETAPTSPAIEILSEPKGVPMVPWTWKKLTHDNPWNSRNSEPDGAVVFEAEALGITPALARMSAIFAHHFKAVATASHFLPEKADVAEKDKERSEQLLQAAKAELTIMGARLQIATHSKPSRAKGILTVARQQKTHAIVLGHTHARLPSSFQRLIEEIVENASCNTVVFRFLGVLHTERILVVIVSMGDLMQLKEIICALAAVGPHRLTILRLLPSYKNQKEQLRAKNILTGWIQKENLSQFAEGVIEATEARVETIMTCAENNDLIVMSAPETNGLQKLFFGSLVERVSNSVEKNMIMLYPPAI